MINQELARTDAVYVFGVFRKEDDTHPGMIDIATLARSDFQWGSFGYTIQNPYWRKGYGKEAVHEAFHIAFEHLKFHRVEAHINLDNTPSMKLAERVGMEFECVRKGFIHKTMSGQTIWFITRISINLFQPLIKKSEQSTGVPCSLLCDHPVSR